jgi:hypothetical protein
MQLNDRVARFHPRRCPLRQRNIVPGRTGIPGGHARGETEERLYLLDAWDESALYSEREHAAPARTEAVTLVSQTHVPDRAYDQARTQFSEAGLVKLTLCVAAINAWNRIAISFRAVHSAHWKSAT